jgi:GNAT superfamily N-acetyltransferase
LPGQQTTPITIERLTAGCLDASVRLLCRAFQDDPIITFYLHGNWRRTLAFPVLFRDWLRSDLPFGHAYVALVGGKVVAVAVWRPPGAGQAPLAQRVQAQASHLALRLLFPTTGNQLLHGFEAIHARRPEKPHWYLSLVGVDTGWQGRGIGSNLLRPILDVADAANLPCYVDTPFVRDIVFYQRLGFKPFDQLVFPGAGRIWFMLRESAKSPHEVSE